MTEAARAGLPWKTLWLCAVAWLVPGAGHLALGRGQPVGGAHLHLGRVVEVDLVARLAPHQRILDEMIRPNLESRTVVQLEH